MTDSMAGAAELSKSAQAAPEWSPLWGELPEHCPAWRFNMAAMIVATAQDAAHLFAPLLNVAEVEKLVVAHLDGARWLLGLTESAGSEHDHVGVPVRRILEDALRLGGEGLVLAHNHPSGRLEPSAEDIEATRDLAATAARLGIRLHDHLILADGKFRSLRSMGLL